MRYYKVPPEQEQKRRRDGSILVANELYTGKELERYAINPGLLAPVDIPKSEIYFFFGARFAMSEEVRQ